MTVVWKVELDRRERTYGRTILDGEEARKDTILHGFTWLVEGALSNGVILRIKGELDGVALAGLHVGAIEDGLAFGIAHFDLCLGSEGEGKDDERKENSGMHG